ncbi:MAG: hypothetical protein GEU99_21480 [Luteitalea sp.]|nr:hypothetical protein [Luteitalea sp.]
MRFESHHLAGILPFVASGFGISIVPAMAARHDGCQFVAFQPPVERRIGYLRLRAHAQTPALKTFLVWLRQAARDRGSPTTDGHE